MNCLSYANNHTQFTEKIPVPLQRLRISEYCQRNGLRPSFEHLELYTLSHMPILHHILEECEKNEIIFFSIYSLPEDQQLRAEMLSLGIQGKNILHFSNEDLVVQSMSDIEALESILEYGDN